MQELGSLQSSSSLSSATPGDSFQPGPQLDSHTMPLTPVTNSFTPQGSSHAQLLTPTAAKSGKSFISEAQPMAPPATNAAGPSTAGTAGTASPGSALTRTALQWKPMGRAASTPDKQELGRRKALWHGITSRVHRVHRVYV